MSEFAIERTNCLYENFIALITAQTEKRVRSSISSRIFIRNKVRPIEICMLGKFSIHIVLKY